MLSWYSCAMETPGAAAQLKYLTSTPYGQGEQVVFGNIEQQNFYQATTPYNNLRGFGAEVRGYIVALKNDGLDVLYKARGQN
jgi:hypothetical protein